jgi:gliding motility-associated-like protein
MSFYLKTLLLLCSGWLANTSLYGQCDIQLVAGSPAFGCVPLVTNLRVANTSGKTATSYKWDFGDGTGNVNFKTDSVVNHTYGNSSTDTTKNFQAKCTITFSDGTTCSATASFLIKVWDLPKAKINFPVDAVQCFKSNKYCFTQSSKIAKNTQSKIEFYSWDLGDGTLDSGASDGSPRAGCHHYQSSGTYQISLTVTDGKGCHNTDVIPSAKIIVLPDLVPVISVTQKQKCGYTDATFTNGIKDTTGWHVVSFSWDFGDGSAPETKKWGKKPGFKHHYGDTGVYYPTFTIVTKEGCHETTPIGAYPITVVNAHLNLSFKDSICWSDASGSGVTFHPKPLKGVVAAMWNFCTDDPIPNCNTGWLPDLADQNWKFGSGPKLYQIKLTVIHDVCDTIDTCFIVHVKGPGALINITLPPPYETYRGPKPLNYTFVDRFGTPNPDYASNPFSLDPFYDMLDTIHKKVCIRSIRYQSFSKVFPVADTTYGYCYASTLEIDTTKDTLCLKLDKHKLPKHVVLGWGQIVDRIDTLILSPTSKKINFTDSAGTFPITFSIDSLVKYFSTKVNGKANQYYRKSPPPSAYLPGQPDLFTMDSFIARMIDPIKVPISQYNAVVSNYYRNDSFQNRINTPGVPITKYNAPVSDQFSYAQYKARRKNPKIAPTLANTITPTPMLWKPASGKFFPNDMHDSDLWSCEPERLVRFTNNSTKFRLLPHTDDHSMGMNPDTCAFADTNLVRMRIAHGDTAGAPKSFPYFHRGNYPYSSDSLVYYWDFGDGYSGNPKLDTAYFSFHDQRDSLEYSREAAPWHYYKPSGQKGKSCYSVSLKVKDLKMGCESSASQILLVNKPKASWDSSCYCKMNFYIQAAIGFQDASTCLKGFKLVPPQNNGPQGGACASNSNGGVIEYKVNFKETLPGNCNDPQNYWVVFDSALALKYSRSVAKDSLYYRFNPNYPPLPPNTATRDRNGPAVGPIDGISCFANGKLAKNGDYTFDTLWDYQWLPKAAITQTIAPISPSYWWGTNPTSDPYQGYTIGSKWAYPPTDSGCKTLGVVIQNGDCYDTVWYHNYICFNKQVADVNFGTDIVSGTTGLGVKLKVPGTLGDIYGNPTSPYDTLTFEGHKYDSLMEPLLGYWAVGAGGGQWVWYPGEIRPPLPRPYPGWVETPTRATYPDSKIGYSPAATIRIKAKQTGQPNIVGFKIFVDRLLHPDASYYYNDTFKIQPDTANFGTGWSDMDSVSMIKDTVYKLVSPKTPYTNKDTATPGAIWFNVRDYTSNPQLNTNFFVNALGTALYVTDKELNLLKAVKGKIIPIAKDDPRYPGLDISCTNNAKVSLRAYLPASAKIKQMLFLLNLNDTTSAGTDSISKKKPHTVMKFRLPLPGVYKVTSLITDLYGCQNGKYYYIINSHFAEFGSTDSVQCTNKPVHFTDVVRYFTTDFDLTPTKLAPTDPAINPYDHYESWTWGNVYAPNGGLFDDPTVPPGTVMLPAFTPWDDGAVKARKKLWKNWPMAYVRSDTNKQERIWWDFDVDGNAKKFGPNGHVDAKGPKPSWTYKKPGVYTVCMTTWDSTGHPLKTYRRNFIKIIEVKANFVAAAKSGQNHPDTLEFCAPHLYHLLDSSDISEGVGTYHYSPAKPYIFAYEDKVVLPADATHKRPYIGKKVIDYDSIVRWTWNTGDKTQSVTKNTYTYPYDKVFTYNDSFTVRLKVTTAFSCSDSIIRKKYIKQVGQTLRYRIVGPNKGCVPFTVRIQNQDRNGDSTTYAWNLHDGTTQTSDSNTEFVDLTYTHLKKADLDSLRDSSVYFITLTKTGKVFDILSHAYTKCSDTTNANDTVYQIVVYRRDSIGIKGDTSVCPHQNITFSRTSPNPHIFTNFRWYAPDGTPSSGTDTTFTTRFSSQGKKKITLVGTFRQHYNNFTHKMESCDSVIHVGYVNVENVKASFDVDSTTSGALGKFYFKNTSTGGNKYFWTYNETTDSLNHDLGHIDETVSSLDPARYHDYMGDTSLINDNNHDQKDFSYKIRLIAQSPAGCRDTVFKTINFRRDFKTWNVITPNGDGENDVFDPKVEGETFYHIMIFNRWGEKVFETSNKGDDWNGKNRNTGGDCAAGTYYYIVKYDLIGKVKGIGSKTGTITLIR